MMSQVCPQVEEEYIRGLRIVKEHFVRVVAGHSLFLELKKWGSARREPARNGSGGWSRGRLERWMAPDDSSLSPHTLYLAGLEVQAGLVSSLLLTAASQSLPPSFEVHAVGFPMVFSLEDYGVYLYTSSASF